MSTEYPAVSHTFILREVEALREMGREILTCSIRRTSAEHHRGPAERHAARTTFYVIASAARPGVLLASLGAALRRPRQLWQAIKLAWASRSPGARAMLWQVFYLVEALVLAQHLRNSGVTHLHNHFGNSSATVGMLASRLAGIPFSYTLHGPAELFEPITLALRQKTNAAEFVACISHFCRSQAMYFSDPADWGKLRIVHCGVLPEIYDRPKSTHDGIRLLFVGRLHPIKGVRILIDAMAQVRQSYPEVSLTLIGDGEDRRKLETMAAPLGDAITFAGFRSQQEVAEAVAEADVLVLPSFAEGVPVVLMEAMAARTPVICTLVGGVAELVEDGVSGLLVPAGDTDGLARAISHLAAHPELRAAMGEAGRAHVRAEFDQRLEAERLSSLFDGMGGAGPRPEPPRADQAESTPEAN